MWNDDTALRAAVTQRAGEHLDAAARRRLRRRPRHEAAPRQRVLRLLTAWSAGPTARPTRRTDGPCAERALCRA